MTEFPATTTTEVIHRILHRDRTTAQRIAARMGRPYHTVVKWGLGCNGDERPVRPHVDELAPFTLAAESFELLDFIEAAVGRVAIELPEGAPGTRELAGRVCAAVKEFGDLAREAGAAIADGTVTRKESERIERESLELLRAVCALVEAVKGAAR
jgi:hypothetical protein